MVWRKYNLIGELISNTVYIFESYVATTIKKKPWKNTNPIHLSRDTEKCKECIMKKITALLRRIFNQAGSLDSFSPLKPQLVAVKTVITWTERLNAHERKKKKQKANSIFRSSNCFWCKHGCVDCKTDCLWERSKAGVIYNWEASNEKDVPAVCSLW